MNLWAADFRFYLARSLCVVGVALGAVAWASVLSSEAQQSGDPRALVQVGAAIVCVLIGQWRVGLPPSAGRTEVSRRDARRAR